MTAAWQVLAAMPEWGVAFAMVVGFIVASEVSLRGGR